MNTLDDKPCPRCNTLGSLVFVRELLQIECQQCHARFRVSLPPLALATESTFSKLALPVAPSFKPTDPALVIDYVTQTDAGGNIHTEEISRYRVEPQSRPPTEFDPNNPRTAFVLFTLAKKAKNRRRYNKALTKKLRKTIIDNLQFDEVLEGE